MGETCIIASLMNDSSGSLSCYATGYHGITIRKLCYRVSCGKKFFRIFLKQWILAKFLCDRVYFWAFFMRQGKECGEICHTPLSSPSQVLPGGKSS